MRTLTLPILLAAAVGLTLHAGTTWAQEADGLPLPDAPGDATFPPPPEARVTTIDGRFPLAGAWKVAGRDPQGALSGTVTFTQDRGDRYRYVRYVSGPGRGQSTERGQAIVQPGRLLLREDPPAAGVGLTNTFEGPDGAAGPRSHRQAIYKLRPDGRTLDGVFRQSDGQGAGEEVLVRASAGAANNDVHLLVDGVQMFPELRAALAGAKRTIVLQTFIYTDDSTGRSVSRILCERARAGVSVRVLVDKVGDHMGDIKDELKAAGVDVIVQHGIGEGLWNGVKSLGRGIWNGIKSLFGGARPAPTEDRGLLNHDHRKITIVDGRIGFLGGMNIAREYEHDWHDIHASVRGSAVAALEDLFYERWAAAGGKGERPPAAEPEASDATADASGALVADGASTTGGPGDLPVDIVGSLPGLSTAIKDRYRREIQQCRSRVLIENAYFLDDDVIHDLQAAAGRGLRTVVILPPDENHDVPVVRDAFSWVRNDVVRSGIELYLYRDRMVHSKVASFDGLVGTVGSSNLDNLALHRLAEVNAFIPDRRFAAELEQRVFSRDIPRSKRVQVQELSWWQKVKGGTLHFFRSFM